MFDFNMKLDNSIIISNGQEVIVQFSFSKSQKSGSIEHVTEILVSEYVKKLQSDAVSNIQ